MQFSLAFSVGGFPIFLFSSCTPRPPHTLSASKPTNYTQAELMYTHSPQANADTWQIKGLINSLSWTISPHHQRMKNKQILVGWPGHLVGLAVDDWVAQGCSVWGLGWSHNCFLWAAQPPEPLHDCLSGWYSPPPSFPLMPQTPTLSCLSLSQTLLSPSMLTI